MKKSKLKVGLFSLSLEIISLFLIFRGVVNHDWYALVAGMFIALFLEPIEIIHWQGREE